MAQPDGNQVPSFGAQTSSAETRFPWVAAGGAAAVLLVVAVIVALASRHKAPEAAFQGPQLAGPAPYAKQLPLTGVQLSEADSFAGNKATYIDGKVSNTGTKTVTGAVVQVVFLDDQKVMVDKDAVPLTRIRSREPYVDSVSLDKLPLKPGETAEFRLIFDHVPAAWDQSVPNLTIVQTTPE